MKSGDVSRLIYVQLTKERVKILRSLAEKLWNVVKLLYGISEAGRQWALFIEFRTINYRGSQQVRSAAQL